MRRRAAGLKATLLWLVLAGTSSIALADLDRHPAGATETADIEGDREGFVWLASIGGLAKFDGRTFTRYSTDPLVPLAMPQLEVGARSGSGQYSSTVAPVTVVVEPAWWETRLVRFGTGIAIIALLGLAMLAWARSGRRRQHQLEWLVAQRTAALSDQTERATAANEAKTRFLSNISHELRNPLHSVLGFAELIRREESAVERHGHWADCIYASGSDLLGMIEELLELSSLQSAPPSLQVGVMRLGSTLSSVAEAVSLMPGASAKDFCVSVDVTDDAVLCDARRLRQVLVNLLANAVRYSTGDRIELSVLQRPVATIGVGRYRFGVRDEGPGMSAEEAEQIFEPFIRGSRASGAGAGLGLSISQQLVNRLGGKLSVDTEPGAPSEFWFELDLAVAPSDAADSTIDLRADVVATSSAYRRALIVDDDPAARQLVADSLAMLGVQTVSAATAEEAVTAAETFRPDILFVDHSMPTRNGSDTAEAVRAVLAAAEVTAGPFVVAVTGQLEQARAESKDAYDCYLQKPVRLAELAAAIRRDSDEPGVRAGT